MSVFDPFVKVFKWIQSFPDSGLGKFTEGWEIISAFLGIVLLVGIPIAVMLFATTSRLTKALQQFTKQHIADVKKENGYGRIQIEPGILPTIKKTSYELAIDFCKSDDVNKSINTLLNEPAKVYFIVGEGGSGKTTLLLYLAEWFCKHTIKLYHPQINCDCSNVIAQLVTSRELNEIELVHDKKTSFLLTLISDNIQNMNHSKKINKKIYNRLRKIFAAQPTWEKFKIARAKRKCLHKGANDFRLLLLIDGYNELNSSIQMRLDEELRQLNDLEGDCVKVIVSSRYKHSVSGAVTYKVQALSEEQIKPFLQKDAPVIDLNLLKSPIRLSMYCRTYTLHDALKTNELPINDSIITASNIYWNYMCSHLLKSIICSKGTEKDKESIGHKAIILFYVLPYMAMILEADNKMEFSLEDFSHTYNVFCKNMELFKLRTDLAGLTELVSEEHWDSLSSDKAASMLDSFLVKEIALIRKKKNSRISKPYVFCHQLYRNFYAAVYRVQRDICTLFEDNLTSPDRAIPIQYKYSDCEKLPDISLVVRKFYYELVGYYIMKTLGNDERTDLLPRSVRLNSLLSDLHYYGDAYLVGIEQNYKSALEYAEKAIEIAVERIKNIDVVEEQAQKTDMTLLCWIRWCAIHIIQKFKGQICIGLEDPDTKYMEYVRRSYEYAKDSTRATDYGEFVGYDKLAQMLINSRSTEAKERYLPDDIINRELADTTGMTVCDKMTHKILEYLKKGEDKGYHYSFSKHAFHFGEEPAKKCGPDNERFGEYISIAYKNYQESYRNKESDIYALARIIFLAICYNDILDIQDKEIFGLIKHAEPLINDMLQLSSPTEIYGYINFCENVAFYYLYKLILPDKDTLNSKKFVEIIKQATKGENGCIQVINNIDEPESYFSKLFSAVMEVKAKANTQLGSLQLPIDNWTEDTAKIFISFIKDDKSGHPIKAFIAYMFAIYVKKGFPEKNIEITTRVLKVIVESSPENPLLKTPNWFFKEERYSVMLQFLLAKLKVGCEDDELRQTK